MANNKNFVRKHFFINRRLQGRYMITFLVPMLIMLLFMIFTLYFAAQTIVNTTTATIKQEIQDKMTERFQDDLNPSVETYQKYLQDINSYLRNFSTSEKYRRALLSSLMWVFGIGILLIIIQVTLLTIFFSHKLAGPIYRFERVFNNIIEGNYIQEIALRKGDDLVNLADLFNKVIIKTRERLIALKNAPDNEKRAEIAKTMKLDS